MSMKPFLFKSFAVRLCLGLYLVLGTSITSAEDNSAEEILNRADDIRLPDEGFQMDVYISTLAPERDAEKRKYRVLSKGNENTLVLTLEPAAEKGQILLMKQRDLWVFLPNISQPIRLSLAQRLTGQVANGDLARSKFSGDYNAKIIRTETIEGDAYYVLDLTAQDRGLTYNRVLYWVKKSDYQPLKAEFYSLSGRLLKTCKYENYQPLLGKQRPTRLVLEDSLKKGEQSIMEYASMQLRDLPDKVFTKDYLNKLQN